MSSEPHSSPFSRLTSCHCSQQRRRLISCIWVHRAYELLRTHESQIERNEWVWSRDVTYVSRTQANGEHSAAAAVQRAELTQCQLSSLFSTISHKNVMFVHYYYGKPLQPFRVSHLTCLIISMLFVWISRFKRRIVLRIRCGDTFSQNAIFNPLREHIFFPRFVLHQPQRNDSHSFSTIARLAVCSPFFSFAFDLFECILFTSKSVG